MSRGLRGLARMTSRSLENPSVPLDGSTISSALAGAEDLWGPDAAGRVDPMRIGTVYRCVQIIAEAVAGCPLKVYTGKDRNRSEVDLPVLQMIEPGMSTPFELWGTTVAHMALWGNAYLRKVYDTFGQLVQLVPIDPWRVTVDTDDIEGAKRLGRPFVKRFTIDGKTRLTEYDVMHIPTLSMDGVLGLSVIGNMRRTFTLAANAERVAERMYSSGMLASGVVSLPAPDGNGRAAKAMTDEEAMILKRRWRALSAGVENASDVIIMTNGATYQQLSMSPADAQFLETRKFSVTDIARLFGVAGWMVNDQEKSTSWGTGMETMFTTFVQLTLNGYFKRIEQRVTREVADPRTEVAEFKVEGLLRGDSKTRAVVYGSGIQHGYYTPNDIRRLENMPDVEWGDEPFRPYNASAGSQAADEDQPAGGGKTDDDDDE